MEDGRRTRTGPEPEPRLVFFDGRPEDDWVRLLQHTQHATFAAGDLVSRTGDTDRDLVFLMQGSVEALQEGDASGPMKRIDAPAVLGEVSFVDGGPRSLTLRATSPGWLARLSPGAFNRLAAEHPDVSGAVLFDLSRIMASRLRMNADLLTRSLQGEDALVLPVRRPERAS